jgi:hypothetical protein
MENRAAEGASRSDNQAQMQPHRDQAFLSALV